MGVYVAMKEIALFLVCFCSLANGKDVRNILCSAEKPCEVNVGDCSLDNECRGNLICTRNNCEGPRLSLYAKCCQEPGEDIFYLSILLGNHWWILSLLIL